MNAYSQVEQKDTSLPFSKEKKEFDEGVYTDVYWPYIIVGKRKITILEPYYSIETEARFSNNSYFVYFFNMPNHVLPIKTPRSLYHSDKETWVNATWESTIEITHNIYNDIKRKINELTKLQKNWNSYNAKKISKSTCLRIITFLDNLIELINYRRLSLLSPFVVPCPNGSIQLEWENNKKELEVIIPCRKNKPIEYLRSFEDFYEEGLINSPRELVNHIMWLKE